MFNAPSKRERSCSPKIVLWILAIATALCGLMVLFRHTTPANAQGSVMIITQCKTLEDVREVSRHNWDEQVIYADSKAQAIMRAFNEIPPRTTYQGDRVMLAKRKTRVGLMRYGIVLEVKDCVENYYRLRPNVYRQLMEAADGDPI